MVGGIAMVQSREKVLLTFRYHIVISNDWNLISQISKIQFDFVIFKLTSNICI